MTVARLILDRVSGAAYLRGPDNPNISGVNAPIGSIYAHDTNGQLFSKFGAADTDWASAVTYPVKPWEIGVTDTRFIYGHVDRYGAVGDRTTDDTVAMNRAIIGSRGGTIRFGAKSYRYTGQLQFRADGVRGGWILQGEGSTLGWSGTTHVGTELFWDGDDATIDTMDFGYPGKPLYIAGVAQSNWQYGQFNNQIRDLTITTNKGCKSIAYVHDQDGFQVRSVYIEGQSRNDVRGVFDCRGTANNMRFEQLTVMQLPNAYGIRAGDASNNWRGDQVFMEGVGLPYWIGDTPIYQDSYPSGNVTLEDCTFEGLDAEGKFIVTTLAAAAAVNAVSVTLTSATGMAIGDPIYLGKGSNKFEMNRITSVAGNVVGLAYGLDFAHTIGEPIKAGNIAIHIGEASSLQGRQLTVNVVRPMFDRYGCCIDASRLEGLNIITPKFVSYLVRGLYLDGDCQNILLQNPMVLAQQFTTWKLFEITDRGNTYNFTWLMGADKSGRATPYINNQGDVAGFFIGDFEQTLGVSGFPPYFRGLTFNPTDGIVLRETEGAAGFKYRTGPEGSANDNFGVSPGGDLHAVTLSTTYGLYMKTPDGAHTYKVWINDSGAITSTLYSTP